MAFIDDKIKFLSKAEILSDLNPGELEELACDFKWVDFPPGSFIVEQGQAPQGFYLLTAGKVEVFVNREGLEPLKLDPMLAGDTYGEMDLLSNGPSAVNILCLKPCQALVLDLPHFAYMLVRWPKLHNGLIKKLSDKLNQTNVGFWESKHREFLLTGLQSNYTRFQFDRLLGSSANVKELEAEVAEMATSGEPLLLIGEEGTGRQMLAWSIHKAQYGEDAPFIVLDSRHLDQQWGDLLFETDGEAEVLTTSKGCLLDLATGGTFLIRDMNLLSPRAQLKLATNLKYRGRKARVIGSLSNEPECLQVKLIPELRSLFTGEYRLKPLRERKRDIPDIATGVFAKLATQHKRVPPQLDEEATRLLLNHHFKQGNVTELIDILERAFFLAEGTVIGVEHLFFGPPGERLGRGYNLLSWKWFKGIVKRGIFPRWFQLVSFAVMIINLLLLFFVPGSYGLLLVWGLWWPSLMVTTFTLGRIWCSVCPVSFTMELFKKMLHVNRFVPNLIKKYDYLLTTFLFLLVFWVEAITGMRGNKIFTGFWLLTIIIAASIIGAVFKRHTWCRHLCPLGGLIGMASISGMVEVRANPEICFNTCNTHECYRGTEKLEGCPMFQHAAFLDSNQACKLCLRCVRNCPHDNVQVNVRVPAREVWHLVRVNQGYAIFIGVALAILIPISYFEPLHPIWPYRKWFLWYSLSYWGLAIVAGTLTWFLARPFKTKAASKRIKLVFALIPMFVAGYIAYQLHFFPGANTVMMGLGYKANGRETNLLYIPILIIGRTIFALWGLSLTGLTVLMVLVRSGKK